ncbi:hypothetical protein, partial [Nocardia gipuzkoensis]|uniref:hypothetical protein n=1 Tax=Nocardia gipuzkoensis TaxID=2749991 RepID=UPI001C669B34
FCSPELTGRVAEETKHLAGKAGLPITVGQAHLALAPETPAALFPTGLIWRKNECASSTTTRSTGQAGVGPWSQKLATRSSWR